MGKYFRIWFALGRYGFIREMTFRSNFLIKVTVEVLWLSILLIFYNAVFANTDSVATWSRSEYMFYVGCYFSFSSILEAFFLENCGEFANLIRTGDLDFYLLKPIDEQFLLSCRKIDWSTIPSIFMGIGVMVFSLVDLSWEFDIVKLGLFVVLMACGVGIGYSFLLMITASSVWLVRNQSLYEIWWLFSSLLRYPRDIFTKSNVDSMVIRSIGWVFTFVLPILLAINVPANVMVKAFEPWFMVLSVVMAVVLLTLSRWVFRSAMRHYRSASS
ncbi:MAG: ABC transporter permease [Gemmataceae bacterium]